jgi:hypothetical protein
MAAILEESTEECNNNRDKNTTDTLAVQQDKWSTLEIIKLPAKGGGKEAEEDAAQFLFAYNVALSADPTMHEKLKIKNRVSPADCANALKIATELLDTKIVVPPAYSLLAQPENSAPAESKQSSKPQVQPQVESKPPWQPEKPLVEQSTPAESKQPTQPQVESKPPLQPEKPLVEQSVPAES